MKSYDLLQVCEQLSAVDLLNLSAQELAREFRCNQLQLNRLLRERFGYSYSALRLELRLLKATCLLREPGANIPTVAKQCQFGDANLFAACFQRRFGLLPEKWQKERAGGEAISIESGIKEFLDQITEITDETAPV